MLFNNKGPGRRPKKGKSHFLAFRLRSGSEHDEILKVLESQPQGAKSAWIIHALLCYVRGEVRQLEQEAQAIQEELAADLFGMWDEEQE